MGHYYSEMVGPDEDEIEREISERNRRQEAIKNAVRLGVIAGIEAGKKSVRGDDLYDKPVRVSAIVKKVLRDIF